jgi:hypothetical protein
MVRREAVKRLGCALLMLAALYACHALAWG